MRRPAKGRNDRAVISLFSGGLGLDLGLERAGLEIRVAVECNPFAAETIRRNRPDIVVIEDRIENVSTAQILKAAGLRRGEAFAVSAGPSCQSFSTAGHRRSLADPRGGLFAEFLRVVDEARPRFFVMENVKGILSAAVKHRPLSKRGAGHSRLRADEELGSAFARLLKALRASNYAVVFDLLNAADFGVPQTRERLVFIGSRDAEPIAMPSPTHSRDGGDGLLPWVSLRKALRVAPKPAAEPRASLPPSKSKYLKHIPAGGNWRDLPPRLQRKALGAAFESWGGRSGFLRRLSWDKPAPTLVTRPDSSATLIAHPDEMRVLSVGEYARLQQFPAGWEFAAPTSHQYAMIGNAVPLGLGEAVGRAVRAAARRRVQTASPRKGEVVCASDVLYQRIKSGNRTILNPPRMRRVKDLKRTRAWTKYQGRDKVATLLTQPNGRSARQGAGGPGRRATAPRPVIKRAARRTTSSGSRTKRVSTTR